MERAYQKIFIISLFIFCSVSFGALSSGRYIGVLHFADGKREQLAKLDLIVSQVPGQIPVQRAVLTLHFGDFASREYVSYHYDDVKFNLLAGKYFFIQTDQDLLFSTTTATPTELVAPVTNVKGIAVGELRLKKDAAAAVKAPLIESVWGEYRGVCRQGSAHMQLYTMRSREASDDIGNPFAAYEIRGSFARRGSLCDPQSNPFGRPCVTNNIVSGSYNFFDGLLRLAGTRNHFNCTVDAQGLVCDGCRLKRVSKETKTPRVLRPPQASPAFPDAPGPEPVVSPLGEYVGYLHHEYLNQFQLGRLRLTTFQTGGEGGLRVAASANLYFGSLEGPSLAYAFDDQEVPPFKKSYVLARTGVVQDPDAVLVISTIKDGVARGTWYSNLFGRVGTFEFRKEGLPTLPKDARVLQSPEGQYSNKYLHFIWDLNLTVVDGVSPVNSRNPFSPLEFSGYLWERRFLVEKTEIKEGSYDFYTGRIYLPFAGEEAGFMVGNRLTNGNMDLKWILQRTEIPLDKHELRPYRFRGRR